MANLYLTHHCNRGCPFCFARKVLAQRRDSDEILTVEDITKLLDHYHDGFQAIGLLGGEPFLYPYPKFLRTEYSKITVNTDMKGIIIKVFTFRGFWIQQY